MIAPEQIAQRLGIGLRDGAEEASEDSLTIRCLRQHLGHQLGHVILTGRDRDVSVRSDAAIASDEALLLESRQDRMDRRQSELTIREDLAELGGTQPVVVDPDGVHDAAFEFTQCSHSSFALNFFVGLIAPVYLYSLSNSTQAPELRFDGGPGQASLFERILGTGSLE